MKRPNRLMLVAGLRAVSIPLDRADSVGALLQPGDWVDVLLSIQATDGSDPAADPSEVQPDVVAVLAVTPQQAEVIRFAQLDGDVSLALRSPADYGAGEVTTSGITLQQLVDTYGVLPPAPITAR